METNHNLTTESEAPASNYLKPLSFWGGLGIALLFLVIQLVTLIPIMAGTMAVYGFEDMSSLTEVVMTLGLPLGFIAGAWILSRKGGLNNTAYQWKSNFLLLTIIGLLLTFAVSYIIGVFITYLPGYETMMQNYKGMFGDIDPTELILTVAVIGPICEEIIFRGVILERLLKKYNPNKAILFSSMIFSIIHLQPLQVISTFFIGLILGWIYLKTQSLWVCIGIHIINNFVAVMTMDDSMDTAATYFDNNLLYIGSVAVAIGIAYLSYIGLYRIFEREEV